MRRPLSILLLSVAVLIAFSPVLSNDWVDFDDPEALVDNDALRASNLVPWSFTTTHMSHFQPLSWVAWSEAGRSFGFRPFVFHGMSLAVHLLNAVLLFFVIDRFASRLALAGAGLFALHPLRVEPVAWASAFPYLLATSFLLLATWLYLTRRSLVASSAAYALSILARPIAPAFPVVLLLFDLFPLERVERSRWHELLVEKIPFAALSVVGLALEGRARSFLGLERFGLGARLTLVAESVLEHVARTLWPFGLTPLDPLPLVPELKLLPIAIALGLVVTGGVVVWRIRARFPAAPVLFLSWLLLAVPTLGFAPSGLQATADRYSYVPAIALATGAVLILGRNLWIPALLGVALAAGTYPQCRWWHDAVTLWARAAELDPTNDLALYFHAGALAREGRTEEAIGRYREVLRLVPDHAAAREDLARLARAREARAMELFTNGRHEQALPALGAAFEDGASSPEVPSALAFLWMSAGDNERARSVLERGLLLFPGDVGLSHNLARLLVEDPARSADALALARDVVEATGGEDPRALDTLGLALAANGRRDEALAAFEQGFAIARSRGDGELAHEIGAHGRTVLR